tara:strand:- start:859 stop:1848 length:990 start_codon:yes stop_codon:yes gene_type:complete
MSNIRVGVVEKVNLKDKDVNKLYSITVITPKSMNKGEICFPIDANIKRIPIIGETVVIVTGIGAESAGGSTDPVMYYIPSISLQKNISNNALPGGSITKKSKGSSTSYSQASAGTPNTSGGGEEHDYGKGFTEPESVNPLQPFLGDVLLEGRFGHSLRFGYTPSGAETSKEPSWSSSTVEDPITILSNGRSNFTGYNKFVIESVDDDLSSIYLTSSQKISIKTSQTNLGAASAQSSYSNPSVVITSDRILLNSKEDSVIISAKNDIINATPSWAMEMDTMFTILEGLIQQVADLTAGTATFATGVGPTGPATNVADVQKLLTDLKAMAQ